MSNQEKRGIGVRRWRDRSPASQQLEKWSHGLVGSYNNSYRTRAACLCSIKFKVICKIPLALLQVGISLLGANGHYKYVMISKIRFWQRIWSTAHALINQLGVAIYLSQLFANYVPPPNIKTSYSTHAPLLSLITTPKYTLLSTLSSYSRIIEPHPSHRKQH